METFAGIDWGSGAHAVCAINGRGQSVAHLEVKHDAGGLTELIRRLRKLPAAKALRIAIERPSGLLVDAVERRLCDRADPSERGESDLPPVSWTPDTLCTRCLSWSSQSHQTERSGTRQSFTASS
jgi:Transposase